MVFDNASAGRGDAVSLASFVQGNLRHRKDLHDLLCREKPDAVKHLAAWCDSCPSDALALVADSRRVREVLGTEPGYPRRADFVQTVWNWLLGKATA